MIGKRQKTESAPQFANSPQARKSFRKEHPLETEIRCLVTAVFAGFGAWGGNYGIMLAVNDETDGKTD